MTDKRKMARAVARQHRAGENDEARRGVEAARECVSRAVSIARAVLSDKNSTDMLLSQGVQSLPRSLANGGRPNRNIAADLKSSAEKLGEECLDFTIAWTFFFPLFANRAVAAHLEQAWPGFTLAMKDAFISLVIAGPFPR